MKLIGLIELANKLEVSRSTLWRLAKDKYIGTIIGKSFVFSEEEALLIENIKNESEGKRGFSKTGLGSEKSKNKDS